MSGSVTKTAYYVAAIKDAEFAKERGALSIGKYARANPQFQYSNVSYKDYSEAYSEKGWRTRKIIALPAALWSGIVKTIYHIGELLMALLASIGGNQSLQLRASAFRVVRDLEEGFGRLVSLFHDKYGSYHIEQSTFHNACYDSFYGLQQGGKAKVAGQDDIATVEEEEEVEEIEGEIEEKDEADLAELDQKELDAGPRLFVFNDVIMPARARFMTLLQLKALPKEERASLLAEFHPQNPLTNLEQQLKSSIDDVLDRIPDPVLDSICIGELTHPLATSPLKYATMTDEEFSKLKASGVYEFRNYANVIKARLALLQPGDPLDECPGNGDLYNTTSLPSIANLTSDAICRIGRSDSHLHQAIFAFVSNAQLSRVQLSDLGDDQIKYIFEYLTPDQIKARLALFTPADIATNFRQLPTAAIMNLSDAQIADIQLVSIEDVKQVHALFESLNSAQIRKRLAVFDAADVAHNIAKLPVHIRKYVAENPIYIKFLKFSSRFDLMALFPHGNPAELRKSIKQFALLPTPTVEAYFQTNRYNIGNQWELLSDTHWAKLDFSKIDCTADLFAMQNGLLVKEGEKKRRISLVPVPTLQAVLVNDTLSRLYCDKSPYRFSDEQWQKLELSKLPATSLDHIFGQFKTVAEKRRVISLIDFNEIREIIAQKLYPFLLDDLSDEQIRHLDFSQFQKDQLESLTRHPSFSGRKASQLRELRKKCALIPDDQMQAALVTAWHKHGLSLLSDQHLANIKFSELTEDVCKSLFASGLDQSNKFAKIPYPEVEKLLQKDLLNGLAWCSDEHFQQLRLSTFTLDQIEKLFITIHDRVSDVLKLIPVDEVRKAFAQRLIPDRFLSLIS